MELLHKRNLLLVFVVGDCCVCGYILSECHPTFVNTGCIDWLWWNIIPFDCRSANSILMAHTYIWFAAMVQNNCCIYIMTYYVNLFWGLYFAAVTQICCTCLEHSKREKRE
jgi:hypothetical protein